MNNNSFIQRCAQLWNSLASPVRIALIAIMDIALIGLGLCIFALFHHVIPKEEVSLGVVSSRSTAVPQATAAPTAEPAVEANAAAALPIEPTAAPTQESSAAEAAPAVVSNDPVGYFGTKFADKFTSGKVINKVLEDGTRIYQSANLNLTGNSYVLDGLVYHVIDIYVKDISCLKSAFANNKYGTGQRAWPADIAEANNAVAAINGDYYSARSEGVVLRNGELFRGGAFGDVGVLYWDGVLETYSSKSFNLDAVMERGAYQIWNFGPMLLDANGQTMTEFDSAVNARNPRTAIGYYEPGHYCFVVVDGRTSESKGLTTTHLSKLMYDLGCTSAYNLDGGQTSTMVWNGEVMSNPYNGGRKSSDIIMVGEP